MCESSPHRIVGNQTRYDDTQQNAQTRNYGDRAQPTVPAVPDRNFDLSVASVSLTTDSVLRALLVWPLPRRFAWAFPPAFCLHANHAEIPSQPIAHRFSDVVRLSHDDASDLPIHVEGIRIGEQLSWLGSRDGIEFRFSAILRPTRPAAGPIAGHAPLERAIAVRSKASILEVPCLRGT